MTTTSKDSTEKMMTTCHLSDEGTSGPRGVIRTVGVETVVEDAIKWAESQPEHPWECILVTLYGDEEMRNPLETYQIEHQDGAWICV